MNATELFVRRATLINARRRTAPAATATATATATASDAALNQVSALQSTAFTLPNVFGHMQQHPIATARAACPAVTARHSQLLAAMRLPLDLTHYYFGPQSAPQKLCDTLAVCLLTSKQIKALQKQYDAKVW
jgi:hypothetical protein